MPSCLSSSAVHGKYKVCLSTCHQVPCQQVDPSGPLATLRGLLLSDESLANLQRWIVQHWYAVLFVVLAVMFLLVSLAPPVYPYASFSATYHLFSGVYSLVALLHLLSHSLSLSSVHFLLPHLCLRSLSSLSLCVQSLVSRSLLSHSLFPSGTSHDGTLQWCLLIL